MKWKDSGEPVELNEQPGDEPRAEKSFSMRKEGAFYHAGRSALKERATPAALIGGGVLLLVILIAWLIFGSNQGSNLQPINDLEARVKSLEQRLAGLENLSATVSPAGGQGQSITELGKRIDGLESVLTREIDRLSNRLGALQPEKKAPVPAVKTVKAKAAAKTAETGKGTYHVVKAGENLYRISRHYGVKVEELLRLNNLKADAALQPGQKLLVKAR